MRDPEHVRLTQGEVREALKANDRVVLALIRVVICRLSALRSLSIRLARRRKAYVSLHMLAEERKALR